MIILQTLFSFKGRIRRRTLWIYWILSFIIIAAVFAAVGTAWEFWFPSETSNFINNVIFSTILFQLIWFWICLALLTKRFHDRNKSMVWGLVFAVFFLAY